MHIEGRELEVWTGAKRIKGSDTEMVTDPGHTIWKGRRREREGQVYPTTRKQTGHV